MAVMTSLSAVLFMLVISFSEAKPRIVDLTHSFGKDALFWPGNPDFNFTILTRAQLKYFWYEANWFGTAEHSGTHLDSPAHFSKGKWRVHEIPLDNLIGPGVVIDVSEKARNNPDYELNVNDILAWEREYGEMPSGAMLMMNSGWTSKWPNRTLVFGTDTPYNASTFHFPGLSPNAAKWLVANRDIHAFGADTPSVDFGQSTQFQTHVNLYENSIVGLENVGDLNLIPPRGAMIYAIPLKLYDGSGSPSRVFAMLDDMVLSGSSGRLCFNTMKLIMTALIVMGTVTF